MKPPATLTLALLLALAACGESPIETAEVESPPPMPSSAAPPAPYSATPAPYSAPAPAAGLPPSQATPGPIPVRYRAAWAIESSDCTAKPGLTRIAIAPGAVKFYEGQSQVVSVEENGGRELIMQVDHAAEGETARETHKLTLDDAGALTYARGENTFVYRRCR